MIIHWCPHRFIWRKPIAAAILMGNAIKTQTRTQDFSPGAPAPPIHNSL
jgi:hypothetical protein